MIKKIKAILLTLVILGMLSTTVLADTAQFSREHIFAPQIKHTHGSSLVQLPNGEYLACWFYGSGERSANDVKLMGARLQSGRTSWSQVFDMADTPNWPDCNPVLYLVDNKLMLFWIVPLNNLWQDSVLLYKESVDFRAAGQPVWRNWKLLGITQRDDFAATIDAGFKEIKRATNYSTVWGEYAPPYDRMIIEAAKDSTKKNIGWMTRIHPLMTKSGRLILPRYSDGYNLSLCLLSDDRGATWTASEPIVGFGPIQPSIVEKKDGTLVAYMRTSGDNEKIFLSYSKDGGVHWSPAVDSTIANPGSSVEVVALANGCWVLVCNDTTDERNRLSALLSDDEGVSWKWRRAIAESASGSYSYPSVIVGTDGAIHATYSAVENGKETIDYVSFNTEWIKAAQ